MQSDFGICVFFVNIKRHLDKSDLSKYIDTKHLKFHLHLYSKLHAERLRCQGVQWQNCSAKTQLSLKSCQAQGTTEFNYILYLMHYQFIS